MEDRPELHALDALLAPRYTIRSEIGRGGMAVVYLADDRKHARRVALKVLRPELATSLGPDRFLREIRIAAGLNHPHIVGVYDSGQAAGLLYYVMPYVDGESLRTRLNREGPLPLPDVVALARQVADALEHAHGQQIVHRDLKPENILLAGSHALVSDFGVARAVEEAAGGGRLTEPGLAVGTPHYMSPEQAAADARIDARSDQYSLGVVVYEALTGEVPFRSASPRAALARKMTDEIPPIRTVRESVPPAVEAVVMRALARVPADRFGSVAEFVDALEGAIRTGHTGRRRGVRSATSTLGPTGALAAVVAAAWLTVGQPWARGDDANSSPPVIQSIAVLPLQNRSSDAEQEYIAAGVTDALTLELGRIRELHVTSRTSTERYRYMDRVVPEIARTLGVDAIVEGSVVPAADSLIIGLTLVHGPTDRQIWSGSYAGALTDILALQREAALAIARAAGIDFATTEAARLATARPVHPEAHLLWLAGNHHLSRAAFRLALDAYERALRLDSTYAAPYSGIAITYTQMGGWWGPLPPDSAYRLAREYAEKAIELDSSNAEAHIALANVMRLYEWDWEAADAAFRHGMDLVPGSIYARIEYANFLTSMRRFEESIDLGQETLEIARTLPGAYNELAFAMDLAGRDEEAMWHYRASLAFDSASEQTHSGLALYYSRRAIGDSALAPLAVLETMLDSSSPSNIALTAGMYAAIGRSADARRLARLLDRDTDTKFVPPSARGYIHACLGEIDAAIPWFERALVERDPSLIWLNDHGDPCYRRARGDPRFAAIVRKMNFPSN